MLYKLKTNCITNNSDNYIIDYLKSLGIEKYWSFLIKPDDEDEESYKKLKNIDKLIDALHESFINNKTFFLQVDADADGVTSSAIFYSYFKMLYPDCNIEYRLHDGKEHGVILKTVPHYCDVVVIPDAGSNQYLEQYQLSKQGKLVLIMDHHLVDKPREIDNVIIVNNQLSPEFKNKSLSGAGVVYKVIQAYSEKYHDGKSHRKFIDIAALGIISDMMDTRNLDNNYIIYHGLHNIQNPLFKAILKKQSYSISSVTIPNKIDIAFYITPLINGVIRAGTEEEKYQMFEGFIDYTREEKIERKSRGKIVIEDYYDSIARMMYNVKNRQNRIKEKCLKSLQQQIHEKNLDKHQILIVKTSKDDKIPVPQNITGLVAMEILKNYKKPTLVVRPKVLTNEVYYYGSGRAKKIINFESFRDFLKESNLCEYAEGHDMAFGVGLKESNIKKLQEYANNKLKDIDFGADFVEVDYIFKNNINEYMLQQFGQYIYIYGNGIPQPKFAFEFTIPTSNISLIGSNKDTIRIIYNNVTFIKFKDSELANKIKSYEHKQIKLIIIGRSQINEYNGYKNTQIIIDHIEIEPVRLTSLF